MPTLVNDLTPPQRSWLFENFGYPGENDDLNHELGDIAPHFPSSNTLEDRRCTDSKVDSYQPPRDLNSGGDGGDNRSAIFRRSAGNVRGPLDSNPASPRAWSPFGPGVFDDPYCYDTRGFFVRSSPFPPHNVPVCHPADRASPNKRGSDERTSIATDPGGKRPAFPHNGEKLTWQQSFENLQAYKQTYGDCNVPQKYKLNQKLGGWVVRASLVFVEVHISISLWLSSCVYLTTPLLLVSISFTEQTTEKEEEPYQIR